jgi:hypothetical protein
VHLWGGKPRATGELIFNVGPTVHADPSLLWNAYVEPEGETVGTKLSASSDLTDDSSSFDDLTPPFPVRIGIWTSPLDALDVNGDGSVSPLDVLIIINKLNELNFVGGSNRLVADIPSSDIGAYYDTTNDGFVSPLDALLIVNALNEQPPANGEASDNRPEIGSTTDSEWSNDEIWGTALEQYLAEGDEL